MSGYVSIPLVPGRETEILDEILSLKKSLESSSELSHALSFAQICITADLTQTAAQDLSTLC